MTLRSWIRRLSAPKPRTVRKHPVRLRPRLERLEERVTPSTTITVTSAAGAANYAGNVTVSQLNPGVKSVTLIDALNAANNTSAVSGGSYVINLTLPSSANKTITFHAVNNYWYGPDALPAITSNITIQGNGSTLQIASGTTERFFYVSGGPTLTGGALPLGSLELDNLTLQGGIAKGGIGSTAYGRGGGGGLGAGGAIFNQGNLTLKGDTLTNNKAIGGNGGGGTYDPSGAGEGGGMGSNGNANGGGGFGGNFSIPGGPKGGTPAGT